MRKRFASWLARAGIVLALVGCAAAGEPDEKEAVATSEDSLVGACGDTGFSATGSGTETSKELLSVCLATDTACIAKLKTDNAAYDCQKERWKVYNRALAKAAAQCSERLVAAANGIECPCQCPNAGLFVLFPDSHDGAGEVDSKAKVPGTGSASVKTGKWAADPRYYGAWCEISATASTWASGVVTCSGASTCGEAGAPDTGRPDTGTPREAGASDAPNDVDWKKFMLESSFTGA